MKSENYLWLVVLALVAFVAWKFKDGTGVAKTAQKVPPTTTNQPGIQDYVGVARTTIDWVAERFGGWGNDVTLPS